MSCLLDALFRLVGLAGLLALALALGWGFLVLADYFLNNPEDDGVYYPQETE